MPWMENDMLSLREEFVLKAKTKNTPFTILCKQYGISRKTGYKWLNRYENEGLLGLENQSKCPSRLNVTNCDQVDLILKTRDEFPAWGAKKLKHYLLNEGYEALPSVSTFNRILKKHNKLDRHKSDKSKKHIRFERSKPMELLQMDFKGHFLTEEGRCHPLTVIDDHSRFLLCLKSSPRESYDIVRGALEEMFQDHGLPEAMTMDNGPPWKGSPPWTLSKLTVWLMRLGIKVSHSTPYHPQTQGKDERLHRSLKEEVLKYNNFISLNSAQKAFDHWRDIYNYKRPHEGIGMQRPCDRFQKSKRKYPGTLMAIEYDSDMIIRKVQKNGVIDFKGTRIYLGEYLYEENVGVKELKEGRTYDVYFSKTRLKRINF